MKKEKVVKAHKRRTKTGKVVTVRQHTASYDASDKLKESIKKEGAGDELKEIRDKSVYEDFNFSQEEFQEWYEGTGSDADLKVTAELYRLFGNKKFEELNNLAADNYKKQSSDDFFKKNIQGMWKTKKAALEAYLKPLSKNPFITFGKGGKATFKRIKASEAVKLDLKDLTDYVAAETFLARKNVEGALRNAQYWAQQGKDKILRVFFNYKGDTIN